MNQTVRLELWSSCISEINMYQPREVSPLYLQGKVYGHPRFKDGEGVTTSRIVDVQGSKVYTKNGTEYELGEPDPVFVEWCIKNKVHVPTKECPILFHKEITRQIGE